jgi:hypothetical protein
MAERTPYRGYDDVISELITVSRSPLVQTYVIIIVISVCMLAFPYTLQIMR